MTADIRPALYRGTLSHRRFHPKQHAFSYPVCMALLDVDAIPRMMDGMRFASYNRFNWASFDDRDHFGDPTQPIRARVERDAAACGVALPQGPMYLLTGLRYLGYCFNPISFFYCYGRGGEAPVVLGEVNNTFGETKNYWLGPHNAVAAENVLRFRCAKTFHVSPFMEMNLEYDFVLTEPGDRLVVHMNTLRRGEAFDPLFRATLTLDREEWSSANVTRALLRQPLQSAKVIAAIHWQAARLWWKGVPVHTHPDRRPAP